MVYNVSFMYNGVGCANLVDADADIETAKEYFIQEKLNGVKCYTNVVTVVANKI